MKWILLCMIAAVVVAVSAKPTAKQNDATATALRHRRELAARVNARERAQIRRSALRLRKEIAAAGGIVGPIPDRCRYTAALGPDRRCTPGRLNPAVTQLTIHRTICVGGWTRTIRPPWSETAPLKLRLLRSYGQPRNTAAYELDHLIPLELGGAPADTRNLWPEPRSPERDGAAAKDVVENRLRAAVCDGSMRLRAARAVMRTWGR